jgi:hypothetical protein
MVCQRFAVSKARYKRKFVRRCVFTERIWVDYSGMSPRLITWSRLVQPPFLRTSSVSWRCTPSVFSNA